MRLINTVTANPNGQKPSPILDHRSTRSPLCDDPFRNADRAIDEIGPEKSEAKHQPTQRGLSDRVDPRWMIELASLHKESESYRDCHPSQVKRSSGSFDAKRFDTRA